MRGRTVTARLLVPVLILGLATIAPAIGRAGPADAVSGDSRDAYHVVFRDAGLDVPLVQLDVAVSGRDGVPVTDLRAEDFVLVQKKERIPLAGFSSPRGDAVAGDTSDSGRPPLHLALCFHVQFLESGDLAGLRTELATFLREELPSDARVLLALLDPELQILEGFTTDRQRILDRLGDLEPLQGTSRLNTEYAGILREIREQARKPDSERGAQIRAVVPKALLTRIGSVAEQAHGEIAAAARGLARLTVPLSGLTGRKEVLWVTGRLPAQTGESLLAAWRRAFHRSSSYWGDGRSSGAGDRVGVEFETLPEAASFLDTEGLLDDLSEIARARGVILHTLDLGVRRGSRSVDSGADPTGRDSESAARRSLGDRQALRSVAESSGGRDLSSSRLSESLTALVRDLDSRYTLAFTPPQGADGETYEIEVQLPGHRRLKVRHSPTYRARSRDQESAERLVSALLLEPYGGARSDNPLGAVAVPLSGAGEPRPEPEGSVSDGDAGESRDGGDSSRDPHVLRIAVRVPLAGLALVPEGRSHLGQISIFTTRGGDGDASPVEKAVLPIRVANEDLLTAQGRQLEYVIEVPRSPGLRRLAVAVRDDFQTVTSIVMVPLGEGVVAELVPGPWPAPGSARGLDPGPGAR